jgi:bifunctional DNA-binding transcriptional regulator/antitoxin component of YhaV-PrlF toxin-antitoxin module
MIHTVTITSQGQITIPAAFRRMLGLDHTHRTAYISHDVEQNTLTIKPTIRLSEQTPIKTVHKPIKVAHEHTLRNEMYDDRLNIHMKTGTKDIQHKLRFIAPHDI